MNDWTKLRQSLLEDQRQSSWLPTVKLPTLPQAISDFSQLAQDPDADTQELSRIIMTDTGLSTEMLRYANSPAIASTVKIASVQQALTLIGVRPTNFYLTMCGLRNVMKSTSSKLINFQTFWNTNLERALMAREVARLIGADKDLAFTAGMLQDFLLPLITNQLLDEYLDYTEYPDDFEDLVTFERQRFGWDHAQAAAHVMCEWGLPDELICCVYMHHEGSSLLHGTELKNTAAAAVALSSLIPDPLGQEKDGVNRMLQLEGKVENFVLLEIAEAMDEQFQEMASKSEHYFSFLKRCRKALRQLETEAETVNSESEDVW